MAEKAISAVSNSIATIFFIIILVISLLIMGYLITNIIYLTKIYKVPTLDMPKTTAGLLIIFAFVGIACLFIASVLCIISIYEGNKANIVITHENGTQELIPTDYSLKVKNLHELSVPTESVGLKTDILKRPITIQNTKKQAINLGSFVSNDF